MSASLRLGHALPDEYHAQLAVKVSKTEAEFKPFGVEQIDIHPSPASHFRMRAEFKIWHEGNTSFYSMFTPGEYKKPIKIETFTIGSNTICKLMPELLHQINNNETLRHKLFQVEFLTTTTGDSLITLIYHKPLGSDWELAGQALGKNLGAKVIGRSRKQKLVLETDFVTEEFALNNGAYKYQQVEGGFTQPNGYVCQKMLNWAIDVSENLGGDLLELYCGNGNFTLPLSKNFDKVLATEVSKTSVNSALVNLKMNENANIAIARLSSEEFTQAMNKVREFRRLKNIDLSSYQFSTVFVDPPRAGLDDGTTELVSGFDNIIYVSCNPETLARDLSIICKTHNVEKFALFDQFPYTEHRECGVFLTRKR